MSHKLSFDVTGKVKTFGQLFPINHTVLSDIISDKGIDRNDVFHWYTDLEVFESLVIREGDKILATVKPLDIGKGSWSTVTVKPHMETHNAGKENEKIVHSVRQDFNEVVTRTLHNLFPSQFRDFADKEGGGKVGDDTRERVLETLTLTKDVVKVAKICKVKVATVKRIAKEKGIKLT